MSNRPVCRFRPLRGVPRRPRVDRLPRPVAMVGRRSGAHSGLRCGTTSSSASGLPTFSPTTGCRGALVPEPTSTSTRSGAMPAATGPRFSTRRRRWRCRRSSLGAELLSRTAAFAQTLRSLGVEPGDRAVSSAGYPRSHHRLPPATAAIGAIWSACGQDYTAKAALNRLRQFR